MRDKLLRGVLIPLPTVFLDDGTVDIKAMEEIVEFYVGSGIHGLFVNGSFGMGPAMSTEQRKQVAELVANKLNGRLPFIVHCGTVDVYSAIELTAHAKSIGALASALLPPYYYSDHTEYEIIEHFRFVAESVDMPLMIYDNPKYSGIDMGVGRVLKIKEAVPQIRAIKLNIMTNEKALSYIRSLPEDIAVFPTVASSLLASYPRRFDGYMNPPTCHVPELQAAYWNAVDKEDWKGAATYHWKLSEIEDVITQLWQTNGRAPFKEAMKLRGLPIKMFPRWPIMDLTEEQLNTLYERHKDVGTEEFIGNRFVKL